MNASWAPPSIAGAVAIHNAIIRKMRGAVATRELDGAVVAEEGVAAAAVAARGGGVGELLARAEVGLVVGGVLVELGELTVQLGAQAQALERAGGAQKAGVAEGGEEVEVDEDDVAEQQLHARERGLDVREGGRGLVGEHGEVGPALVIDEEGDREAVAGGEELVLAPGR